MDAFVQADRSLQEGLQLGMMVQVVPLERLFNHHQVESIKFSQQFRVCETIGGIGVGHQLGLLKLLSHRGDKIEVLTRFDLDFDTLVPVFQFFLTAAMSSRVSRWIPSETPQAISGLVPPSNFHSGSPLCRASTSQRAVSRAALAISCPRTGSSSRITSEAARMF